MEHQYPATSFLSRLVAAGSELGYQLARSINWPLRQYLRDLIPGPASPNCHLTHLLHAVESELLRHGHPCPDEVCSELVRVPVIQQADHSNILLDAEVFLNNFLFALACREAGAPLMVASQCSTISCLSRRKPVGGPVFLRTRGELYKVFSFSKHSLKDSSFCALPGPLQITFQVLEGRGRALMEPNCLGRFVGRITQTAPDGYRMCNDEIWKDLDSAVTLPRVAFDERLASETLANHFLDPHSPVRALVFDPCIRDSFCTIKRELVAARRNIAVNRAEPDFFWYRKGSRLVPVVLAGSGAGAELVLELGRKPLPVPYTPDAIAEALRSGLVYGDRILAYFVRCLLPGVVAVGGTSQQDYMALYQRIFLACHADAPFLDAADLQRISNLRASRLGGAPLLELDARAQQLVAELGPQTPLREFADSFLDLPVGCTIGKLQCASFLEPRLSDIQDLTCKDIPFNQQRSRCWTEGLQ